MLVGFLLVAGVAIHLTAKSPSKPPPPDMAEIIRGVERFSGLLENVTASSFHDSTGRKQQLIRQSVRLLDEI